MIVEGSDRSLL